MIATGEAVVSFAQQGSLEKEVKHSNLNDQICDICF